MASKYTMSKTIKESDPERYKAILGSFENFSEILYCPRYYAY